MKFVVHPPTEPALLISPSTHCQPPTPYRERVTEKLLSGSQYLHFQFYVLCFGKHHRFILAALLVFINARHVLPYAGASFNISQGPPRTLPGGCLAGWLATLESDGAVVPPTQQTATFNHKLDFYFNLNEIINFGIRFN